MRNKNLIIQTETELEIPYLDLSSDTNWSLPANGEISDNKIKVTSTCRNFNAILSTTAFESGKNYRIEYKVSGLPSDIKHRIRLDLGSSGYNYGDGRFSITARGLEYNLFPPLFNNTFGITLTTDRNSVNQILPNVTISNIKIFEITDEELDLFNDETIPLNFSIQDVQDISKRSTNYSKTIKLPSTPNNNRVLKHVYQVAADNTFKMEYPIAATLKEGGIPIFEGNLYLNKITSTYDSNIVYECQLRSIVNTLFKITNDKYMRGNDNELDDLDFSEYDHRLTYDNISSSWWKGSEIRGGYDNLPVAPSTVSTSNNTDVIGSGYVYPLINYGFPTPSIYIRNMKPAIFIYEIFKKIINGAGYTFTSEFLESERFKRLVFPRVTTFDKDNEDVGSLDVNYNLNRNLYGSTATYMVSHIFKYNNLNSDQTNALTVPFEIDSGSNTPIYFTATESGRYSFYVNLDRVNFMFSSLESFTNFDIYDQGYDENGRSKVAYLEMRLVKKTNSGASSVIKREYINVEPFSDDKPTIYRYPDAKIQYQLDNISYGLNCEDILLDTNERVELQLVLHSPHSVPSRSSNRMNWNYRKNNLTKSVANCAVRFSVPANKLSMYVKAPAGQSLQENSLIKLKYNFESRKLKQSDFIMSIVKAFNLQIDIDKNNEKNLIIEPYSDFYNASDAEILDWTSKRDVSSEFIIEPASNIINKNIFLTWSQDTDNYNKAYTSNTEKIYGEKYIKADIETTDEIKIQPIFAPTPLEDFITERNNNKIVTSVIYSSGSNGDVNDTTHKPRILYWGGLQYWDDGNTNALSRAYWQINTFGETKVFKRYGSSNTAFYPYAGHVDKPLNCEDTFDLNFGANWWYWWDIGGCNITYQNLTQQYYEKMFLEITSNDSKKVTGWFHLTNDDIYKFNFKNYILLDEGGIKSYYRVNKIIDYISSQQLTKVELLKIKEQELPITVNSNRWNRYPYNEERRKTERIPTNELRIFYEFYNNVVNRRDITFNEIRGENNYIATGSRNIEIQGNNNYVENDVNNVKIINSNNVVIEPFVERTTIINTSNIIVNESDVTYIDGVKSKDGVKVDKIDLIRGGEDTLQYMYSPIVINKIQNGGISGSGTTRGFGSQTNINKIEG